MNLQQQLAELATTAPPPADAEHLIRLARRVKARRAAAAPVALVLVTLVALVPGWSPLRPPASGLRPFVVLSANQPIASFPALSTTLQNRALAAGLDDPRVQRIDDRTVELSVAGSADESLLRGVARSHLFHVRKVLDMTPEHRVIVANSAPAPHALPTGSEPATSMAALITKLGDAYQTAQSIDDPLAVDPATMAKLEPFGQLTAAEVELLPAELQFKVPTITCTQLNARPHYQGGPLDQRVTTCMQMTKFLLAAARLTGEEIDEAYYRHDSISKHAAVVNFNQPGTEKLIDLTREALENSGPERCQPNSRGSIGNCSLAMSMGAQLLSAPEIRGVLTRDFEIASHFTEQRARAVAQVITGSDATLTMNVVS
jgi:preprotein translocase subunit SecD